MSKTVSTDTTISHDTRVELTFNALRQIGYVSPQDRAILQKIVMDVISFAVAYEARLAKASNIAMEALAARQKALEPKKLPEPKKPKKRPSKK